MATLAELRARSESLFTELLTVQEKKAPARRRRAGAALAGPPRPPAGATFSWFDPADAVQASALSFRLAALTGTKKRVNDALAAALDHADEARTASHPELVRQGLAMFVTHNRDGRRLAKPRTVVAAPGLFRPPPVRAPRGAGPAISIGGASPGLDYWREDALANEHHQHWHEVYPFSGLPPRDFGEWLSTTPRADIAAILEGLSPGGDWAARVQNATLQQLSNFFAQTATGEAISDLAPPLYRLLFKLNDRQGELFFYMHEQMLARYDAELISNGLARVGPYGPSQWSRPIPEGHDPTDITGFTRREANQRLGATAVSSLRALEKEITDALSAGTLRGPGAAPVPIDRTNLGEAVEAAVRQLRDSDPSSYRGLHNIGHGRIAELAPNADGVMNNPVAAIRDQVFWRWHKHIDDLSADWQDRQAPVDFTDAPPVVVRNGLAARSTSAWASPDIILCRTADLPGTGRAALGQRLFGGAAWDTDFTTAQATSGATTVRTVSELTTTMGTVQFRGRPVRFLTHEPYSYFLRLENTSDAAREVTVRVFLAPSAPAGRDRRTWIEMDKFLLTVPATTRLVAYRADSESSVVKRPVDASPAAALGGGSGPDEDSYCDCGWPYTLLLPRGTSAGLPFRLMVICTDAAIDRVPAQAQCGSMSWCGAVDRYPDTRDMGYPFARPFAGSAANAVRDTIVRLPHAAARTLTIRHTG